MSATLASGSFVQVPAYAELHRIIHEALLREHPEWVEKDGNNPICDDYDRRFAQLLDFSLAFERARAHLH